MGENNNNEFHGCGGNTTSQGGDDGFDEPLYWKYPTLQDLEWEGTLICLPPKLTSLSNIFAPKVLPLLMFLPSETTTTLVPPMLSTPPTFNRTSKINCHRYRTSIAGTTLMITCIHSLLTAQRTRLLQCGQIPKAITRCHGRPVLGSPMSAGDGVKKTTGTVVYAWASEIWKGRLEKHFKNHQNKKPNSSCFSCPKVFPLSGLK
ncbi:hypothetical protein HKD37_19G053068 [Glycine soja]